jgi:hypothetical protein
MFFGWSPRAGRQALLACHSYAHLPSVAGHGPWPTARRGQWPEAAFAATAPGHAASEGATRLAGPYHHLSGGVCSRLAKASRREDVQVEAPVAWWDCAAFDFHPTLAGMLRAPLGGHQVIQRGQPAQQRLLAPFGVTHKSFPPYPMIGNNAITPRLSSDRLSHRS